MTDGKGCFKMKNQYELVKRVFSDSKNHKISGIETNKDGVEVLVVEDMYGDNLWIKLYGLPSYVAINMHPRIMATIRKDYQDGTTYIYIDDINVVDLDCGNGSIVMKYFIESVKNLDADYISGGLSSVDKDHFDRLEHYYKKYGFKVTFNDGRTSGQIKLNLK